MERGTNILFFFLIVSGEGKQGIFSSYNGSSSLSYSGKLCANPPPSHMVINYVPICLTCSHFVKGNV